MRHSGLSLPVLLAVVTGLLFGAGAAADEPVSFNAHVRPILSNHCWNCHGPDEHSRQGGLRLDVREAAIRPGDSGRPAIVPGRPEQSELLARITAHDAETVMPPPETRRPLSEQQRQILTEWIRQGAEYSPHWAFISPVRPELPDVRRTDWPKHSLDRFVLQRLEQAGLQPSAEVAPAAWLRRVTLDLTGLPPAVEELEQFEQQLERAPLEEVYSQTVDRLLSSPRYAERMAMQWLDAARYADTNGYNNDEMRTMWPWRDWVIRAFAQDLPWDQFITQQLAGDLLPEPTLDQKVATGFNRNHVLTTEGGIIEEEYHVEYVADRVHTTATVFMAMSLQCARCHDHKYDPVSQQDYYQFAAFFNNIPDRIVPYSGGRMAEPLLKVPSRAQQQELTEIEQQLRQLDDAMAQRTAQVDPELTAWEAGLTPEQIAALVPAGLVAHFPLDEAEGTLVANRRNPEQAGVIHGTPRHVEGRLGRALQLDGNTWVAAAAAGDFDSTDAVSLSAWVYPEAAEAGTVLSRMDDAQAYRGYDLIIEQGRVASHFVNSWPDRGIKVLTRDAMSLRQWHHVVLTYDGSRKAQGLRIYVDGVAQELQLVNDRELAGTLRTDKPFHIGRRQTSVPFRGLIDDVQLYRQVLSDTSVRQLAAGQSAAVLQDMLAVDRTARTPQQQAQLRQYYLETVDANWSRWQAERAALTARQQQVEQAVPLTMVMAEQTPVRPTYLLKRGQYDQRGEEVQAAVPSVLWPAVAEPTGGAAGNAGVASSPRTRLDLARWLTTPGHPLTARVAVNRWWEMLFGTGLVETSEDFGIQGALPSHPELLDWLAVELQDRGWSPRAVLKQIVLSATYRQSSAVTPELLERDPRNRLLARGARFRLPAEAVRDSALFVSGLLHEQVGGPSVKPYQPDGLWEDVSVERREKYVPDVGPGLYRRSMYTFWKRTCPPPGMSTLDAPDRETCLIRRARTNTPLQALVLLNDPTYLEAARQLAERVVAGAETNEQRLQLACRRVLTRYPTPEEQRTLASLLQDARQHFAAQAAEADKLLRVGASPVTETIPAVELAAWTMTMSMLLNTDEAISRL